MLTEWIEGKVGTYIHDGLGKRPAWYTWRVGEIDVTRIEACECGNYPRVWQNGAEINTHWCKYREERENEKLER